MYPRGRSRVFHLCFLIFVPNRQELCNNVSFALFGRHKTKMVEKGKPLNFETVLSPFSPMIINIG